MPATLGVNQERSRGVVLEVRTPPPLKYQTPTNLNIRTAHGPSTVRDGLRIAPDVRRLFVDRQEPEKLLKLPSFVKAEITFIFKFLNRTPPPPHFFSRSVPGVNKGISNYEKVSKTKELCYPKQ